MTVLKAKFGRNAAQAAKDLAGPVLSEDKIATEFVDRNLDVIRFDATAKQWVVWDGYRWRRDETDVASAWTRELTRDMAEDQSAADRRRLGSRKFALGVAGFARSDQRIAVTRARWDNDIDLIGTPDGIVDLRTGELFDPNPNFFITRATSVVPDIAIDCPRFLQFLNETTGGDPTLKQFLQLWFGYALTAEVREQKLVFLYGKSGAGKGTLANTIRRIMGDYATASAMETFTNSKLDRHPEQLARLDGMRMVVASETEAGQSWRENRVKLLTGGDAITANHMHQNSFTYEPTAKFTFMGNHAPGLANLDDAIRRRMIIIPFNHVPAQADQHLDDILAKEAPGILRWILRGAVDWYSNGHGLILPKAITEATTKYFDDQNIFGQWLEECCRVEPGNEHLMEKTVDLFQSWSTFAKSHGEEPGKSAEFKEKLRHQGFESLQIKALGTKGCRGIRLKAARSWQEQP